MTSWTNTETAQLAIFLDQGMSYSQIGAKLGKTRNAISGKIDRLAKAGNMPRVLAKPKTSRPPAPHPAPHELNFHPWSPLKAEKRPRPVFKEPEVDMTPANPLTLLELERQHCRWPLGTNTRDPNMLYCGDPILEGYSYCPHHCELAYQGGPRYGQPVSGALLRVAYQA